MSSEVEIKFGKIVTTLWTVSYHFKGQFHNGEMFRDISKKFISHVTYMCVWRVVKFYFVSLFQNRIDTFWAHVTIIM